MKGEGVRVWIFWGGDLRVVGSCAHRRWDGVFTKDTGHTEEGNCHGCRGGADYYLLTEEKEREMKRSFFQAD